MTTRAANHGCNVILVDDRKSSFNSNEKKILQDTILNDNESVDNGMECGLSSFSGNHKDGKRITSSSSNSKTYICNICNDTFNRSSLLKLHLLQHSGERTFKV